MGKRLGFFWIFFFDTLQQLDASGQKEKEKNVRNERGGEGVESDLQNKEKETTKRKAIQTAATTDTIPG